MSNSSSSAPSHRLLDRVREVIRIKHYSIRTEAAPAHPCARGIRTSLCSTSVCAVDQPLHSVSPEAPSREMGAAELSAFLSHLAVRRNVSASTQNQALNAILFLYREVLKIDLPWLDDVQRAKKSAAPSGGVDPS